MARNVERFVAVADGGRSVIIIVEQDSIDASPHGDVAEPIAGQKRAYTEDLEPCMQIDAQTWRVPSIGLMRRRG